MIFTRDFVTRENHCRIASLVTKKIVIHGNSCIILYITQQQIENGLSNRHMEDYMDTYVIKLQLKKLLIYFLPLY